MAVRSLAAVRQKFKETHPNVDEWIEFTIDDEDKNATVFKFHHPLFMTNEEKRTLNRASSGDDMQTVRSLMGDAEFDELVADGGQVCDVILLLNQVMEEFSGTDSAGNPTTR